MELPVPAEAPVMLPVMAPMVQLKLLGLLAVSGISGLLPLQTVTAG
jgi:hypothetical protein